MDPTTEAIAHFIGLFEIATEGNRLRAAYEEIERGERQSDGLGELDPLAVRLRFPYELEPYSPKLAYQPPPVPVPPNVGELDPPGLPFKVEISLPVFRLAFDSKEAGAFRAPAAEFTGPIPVPPPSLLANVTVQTAALVDDDLFSNRAAHGFPSVAEEHTAFAAMAQEARALVGFEVPPTPEDSWAGFAEQALREIGQPVPPGPGEHLNAATYTGAEVAGAFLEGQTVDEVPDWSDHLPDALAGRASLGNGQPENEVDDSSGADSGDAVAFSTEEGRSGTSSDGQSGTVSGATGAAGDGAPVVVSESEAATGASAGSSTGEHDFSRDFEGKTGAEDPVTPDRLPGVISGANSSVNEVVIKSSWLDAPVFVVGGAVKKVEAISQANVLVENDRVVGGDGGRPSTVQNASEVSKIPSADEEDGQESNALPQHWGLVRIPGDFLDVNWVEQKTFATDFDQAFVESASRSMRLVLGENEISNVALFDEIGFNFDLIFVAGDMIDVSMISQVNMLYDSDEITGATGQPTSLSSADNLLHNMAALRTTGIDHYTDMKSAFAESAQNLASGLDMIDPEVLTNKLFEGKDFLKVLQIDGDLVRANIVKQTNMIGDADRIHLAPQALGGGAEVTTGSNALLNTVSIEKFGLDSTVMAAGGAYEEAMLYQAELIDRDAIPTGVDLAPLANEAVAFLADGMLVAEEKVGAGSVPEAADPSSALDGMQVMLV